MMEAGSFFAAGAEAVTWDHAESEFRIAPAKISPSPWIGAPPQTFLLGMPQLCLNGLSETWLLKELGHRHWMMLARLVGQASPSFVDERGAPVYAAFCAVSIRDAEFFAAHENDRLVVSSRIRRVSRTQMFSRHELTIAGRKIGEVDMISAFVRRMREGNHGVVRFEAPGLPPVSPMNGDDNLAACAARLRSGRARTHRGFVIDGRKALATARFDPCPSQDFNGAGFLYFSSFVAFIDRAEWIFARDQAAWATTRQRDIFFSGNLDSGESLSVDLKETRTEGGAFAHHCEIRCEQDQAVMAHVFSVRRMGRSPE
jgi:probable biosynthetic protein (TIGR04099 family)